MDEELVKLPVSSESKGQLFKAGKALAICSYTAMMVVGVGENGE